MIHMSDISLYPLYSLYQIGGTFLYIAGAGLISYCGFKIYSAIERYRIGKRGVDASKLAADMDEIGTDPELKDNMYKADWA